MPARCVQKVCRSISVSRPWRPKWSAVRAPRTRGGPSRQAKSPNGRSRRAGAVRACTSNTTFMAASAAAPEQQEEKGGEERELDHHDLPGDQDRRPSQAERNRKEVEGAGKRVDGRVTVELPAVRHDIRELEKVPLVHEARPAVVEGKLEGNGDHRD